MCYITYRHIILFILRTFPKAERVSQPSEQEDNEEKLSLIIWTDAGSFSSEYYVQPESTSLSTQSFGPRSDDFTD